MAFTLASVPTFLKEVRHELKSVQWPTRATTVRFTVLIVVVTATVAAATGAFDFMLTLGVERLFLNR